MTTDRIELSVSGDAEERLGAKVARMANAICGDATSNGDRAALKRWAPGQPIPLVFHRLWLRFVSDELPNEAANGAWMFVAWGLAMMGTQAHRPNQALGRALAEAGLASSRLERLLDAPADVLPDLFSAAVRHLTSKTEGFDWSEAAELLLARSAPAHESIRRRIAVAYYRHQPKE